MRATHRTDRLQPYLTADGYRVFGIEAQGSRDPTESDYSGSVTIWDWTPRNGDLRSNDGEWVLAQRIEGAQANQRLAFGGFAVSPAGTLMALTERDDPAYTADPYGHRRDAVRVYRAPTRGYRHASPAVTKRVGIDFDAFHESRGIDLAADGTMLMVGRPNSAFAGQAEVGTVRVYGRVSDPVEDCTLGGDASERARVHAVPLSVCLHAAVHARGGAGRCGH